MLVIISDLHLSDGSSGETVHQGTLRVFRERLRALAYAASWRAGGKYKPIDGFDIVLLGDILDVLRSWKWFETDAGGSTSVRPWDDPASRPFITKIRSITESILSKNAVFFSFLRELRETTFASLPLADQDGQPVRCKGRENTSRLPVRVRIHYMLGNHDWFYHLAHPEYADIREKIVSSLGLENDPAQPFPHDPDENSATSVQEIFNKHQVWARHGDIFDPVNYEGDRDRSSIGDAVAVDLVARFAFQVRLRFGDLLPAECLAGLNEIDNVRPLSMVPIWVGALLRRTCPDARLRGQVQAVWNDLVDRLMKTPFVHDRTSLRHPFGVAQRLKWGLMLSKRLMAHGGDGWARWAAERIGNPRRPYFHHALKERSFRNRSARFIVYGHTHHHEIIPLDSSSSSGSLFNQMYVNSGTWRPVHELAKYRYGHAAFVGYRTMTYLVFFQDGERGGRRFEFWSGSLSGSTWRRGITCDSGSADR